MKLPEVVSKVVLLELFREDVLLLDFETEELEEELELEDDIVEELEYFSEVSDVELELLLSVDVKFTSTSTNSLVVAFHWKTSACLPLESVSIKSPTAIVLLGAEASVTVLATPTLINPDAPEPPVPELLKINRSP